MMAFFSVEKSKVYSLKLRISETQLEERNIKMIIAVI